MKLRLWGAVLALSGLLAACAAPPEDVIFITATFLPPTAGVVVSSPVPEQETLSATLDPALTLTPMAEPTEMYVVQPGDTLTAIALAHNTTLETLLRLNSLANPDQIEVGQALQVPARPTRQGPETPILPDGLFVRGPASAGFDAVTYVRSQPGFLRDFREEVDGVEMGGPEIIERISQDFGIDARVLLALLEYRSRGLSSPEVSEITRMYPVFTPVSLSDVGRIGLYRQLNWAADRLNGGYYGRKYGGLDELELADGTRLLMGGTVAPGTSALQAMFAQMLGDADWIAAVGPAGFLSTYSALFGDPFAQSVPVPVPQVLSQPELKLPFSAGETWYYTGGPHGGWGSGSAWAAIDFAPPDDPEQVSGPCYVSTYWVTAAADGVIARSAEGVVMLDLDGDGNELTGWTVMYLHLADVGRAASGTRVTAGDRIGHASCEGGVSNGTHVHIARRYNGEWLPASCIECSGIAPIQPSMTMGGWEVVGLPGQEYQGYLINGDELRVAEAFRGVAPNEVTRQN